MIERAKDPDDGRDLVLDEIMDAWEKSTDWEQFGKDVGTILLRHKMTRANEIAEAER